MTVGPRGVRDTLGVPGTGVYASRTRTAAMPTEATPRLVVVIAAAGLTLLAIAVVLSVGRSRRRR